MLNSNNKEIMMGLKKDISNLLCLADDEAEILEFYEVQKVKYGGTSCKIDEAREWYETVFGMVKEELFNYVSSYSLKLSEDHSFSNLNSKKIGRIIAEGSEIIKQIKVYNLLFPLINELYKNPKKYNAWKSEMNIRTIYYVEPKEFEEKKKENSTIII